MTKPCRISNIWTFFALFAGISATHAALPQRSTTTANWKAAYLGALPGVGYVSNGGGGNFSIGLTGGLRVTELLGAGIYFDHTSFGVGSNVSVPAGTTTDNGSNTTLAAEGNFFFRDRLEGLYLGGKVGMMNSTPAQILLPGQIASERTSANALVLGPHAGYDFMVSPKVTLGAHANVLFTTRSGGSTNTNLLAALKWWP